jgi:hypothetical protein
VHAFVGAHFGQIVPPQSRSVSMPLRSPSAHVLSVQIVAVQNPLLQSVGVLQVEPFSQAGHLVPPQSSPVSVPLWVESPQLGALHLLFSQTPLSQSPPNVQRRPSAHPLHEPPQSMSVSEPLSLVSSHAGA